jgi:hypothetical protein
MASKLLGAVVALQAICCGDDPICGGSTDFADLQATDLIQTGREYSK